jgi:hypothetical protein
MTRVSTAQQRQQQCILQAMSVLPVILASAP